MKSSIYIISNSLKEFLVVFDKTAELSNIVLGDTCHPSSGFVDEKVLNGKNRISEILNFDYDFKGLVEFKANIRSTTIEMNGGTDEKEEYLIKGPAREIEMIRNRIIEVNAHYPGKYKFDYHIDYEN